MTLPEDVERIVVEALARQDKVASMRNYTSLSLNPLPKEPNPTEVTQEIIEAVADRLEDEDEGDFSDPPKPEACKCWKTGQDDPDIAINETCPLHGGIPALLKPLKLSREPLLHRAAEAIETLHAERLALGKALQCVEPEGAREAGCTCIRYASCPVHGDPQSDTVKAQAPAQEENDE